jgi:O-antigen ligase/Tfp pilus assembly protein PilF
MTAGIILLLAAVSLAVLPQLSNPLLIKDAIFGGMVLVLLGAWAASAVVGGKASWPRVGGNWPLVGLLLVSVLSAGLSRLRPEAFAGAAHLGGFVGFYFLALVTLRRRSEVRRVLAAVLLLSIPLCLYGILQHFGVEPIRRAESGSRVFSFFGNATYFGGFIVLVLPSLVNLGLFYSPPPVAPRSSGGAGPGRWLRPTCLVLAGLMSFCLLWTYARSAWVGLLLGLGLNFALLARLARKDSSLALGRSLLIAGILSLALFGRLVAATPPEQRQRLAASFTQARFEDRFYGLQWRAAYRIFLEHPFLGSGPGTFGRASLPYLARPWYEHNPEKMLVPLYAHQIYVESLAELGLPGLVCLLWFLGAVFRAGVRSAAGASDPLGRLLLAGMVSGLLAFSGQNIAAVTFHYVAPAIFFWLGAALVQTESLREKPEEAGWLGRVSLRLPAAARGLGLLVIAGLVGWGLWSIGRSFSGEWQLSQGKLALGRGEPAVAEEHLEAAIARAPRSFLYYYWLGIARGNLAAETGDRELLKRALGSFGRFSELLPHNPIAHHEMALAYSLLEDSRAAEREYRRALEIAEIPSVRVNLAALLWERGEAEQAEREISRAIAVAPDNSDYRVQRARWRAARGGVEQAKRELEEVARANPQSQAAEAALAELCAAQGETAEAEEHRRRAAGIARASPAFRLGMRHYQERRWQEAAAALEEAWRHNPRYLEAGFRLTDCYLKLGLRGKALSTLKEIEAGAPDRPEGRKAGRLLRGLGAR